LAFAACSREQTEPIEPAPAEQDAIESARPASRQAERVERLEPDSITLQPAQAFIAEGYVTPRDLDALGFVSKGAPP
jgi:hypothetical protein